MYYKFLRHYIGSIESLGDLVRAEESHGWTFVSWQFAGSYVIVLLERQG